MSTDPFKIDTSDVLGISYNAYKTKMYALALSKPSDYYKLREQVVQKIKDAAVKNIYDVIYDFLKDGKCGDTRIATIGNDVTLVPKYPSSKINEIALGAAESLDDIIEKTIAICLPANYDDIARAKLTQKGQANLPV